MSGWNGVSADLTSLELFAGAGGMALGIVQAGFHHLAILERDARACMTLDANRRALVIPPEFVIEPTDVTGFDYGPFRDKVDLLAGGVPCQPFSLGGKHLGEADERNLFPEMFRGIREVRPAVVIIENVRGLLRETFRPYFLYILDQLARPERLPDLNESWQHHGARLQGQLFSDELTYRVAYQRVNCADFGVPQHRDRVFVVAFRSDLQRFA